MEFRKVVLHCLTTIYWGIFRSTSHCLLNLIKCFEFNTMWISIYWINSWILVRHEMVNEKIYIQNYISNWFIIWTPSKNEPKTSCSTNISSWNLSIGCLFTKRTIISSLSSNEQLGISIMLLWKVRLCNDNGLILYDSERIFFFWKC